MNVVALILVLAGVAVALVARREHDRRRELVARACHEIRGPLTAASLALQLAARGDRAPMGVLAAVDRELDRCARAVDDLWAARSGEPSRDVLAPVELGELLAAQTAAWRALAGAADRAVVLVPAQGGAWVRGDAVRLTQAVSNLVANAVEHGHGTIAVRIRRDRGRVRVEVADDGAGLPAPIAALAKRPRAGRGARGRGLAIAAGIASRHGGRLAAAPTANGARIVLDLPAVTAPGRPSRLVGVPNPAVPR